MRSTYFKYLITNIFKRITFWVFAILYFVFVFILLIIVPMALHTSPWMFWSNSVFSPQMILLYTTGLMASILAIIIFKNQSEDGSELIIASKPIIRRSLTFVKFLVLFVCSSFVALLLSLCGWLTLTFKDVTVYQAFSCFLSVFLANLIMLMFMGAIALIVAAFLNKVWIILINVVIVTIATCFTITTTILVDTPSKQSEKAGSAYTSYQYLTNDTKLHSAAYVYPFDLNELGNEDTNINDMSIKFSDFDGQKDYWDNMEHQKSDALFRTFNLTNQFSLMNNGLALTDPHLTQADKFFCASGNYAYSFDQKLISSFVQKEINQNPNTNEPNFFIVPNRVSCISGVEYPNTLVGLIAELATNKALQKKFIDWIINYLQNEQVYFLGPAEKTSVASNLLNIDYTGGDTSTLGVIWYPNSSWASQRYKPNFFQLVGDKTYQQTQGVGITKTQNDIFEMIYDKMFPDDDVTLKKYYLIGEPNNNGIPISNPAPDDPTNKVITSNNSSTFTPTLSTQALESESGRSPVEALGFNEPGNMESAIDFFHYVLSGVDLQECFNTNADPTTTLHNPKFENAFGIEANRHNTPKANLCLSEAWLKFQYFLFNKLTSELNQLTSFSYRAAYNSHSSILLPYDNKVIKLSSSPFFPIAASNENNEGIYNWYKTHTDSVPPAYYGWLGSLLSTAFPGAMTDIDPNHQLGWPSNDVSNGGQLTYFNNQKALVYRAMLNYLTSTRHTGWVWNSNDDCSPSQFNRELFQYEVRLNIRKFNWLAYENFSGTFNLQPYMSPTTLWLVWTCIDLLILTIAYIIYLKIDIK